MKAAGGRGKRGMKKEGKDTSLKIKGMREVGSQIKKMEKDLTVVEEDLQALLLKIPNVPHPSVPVGSDSEDNPVGRARIQAAGACQNVDGRMV